MSADHSHDHDHEHNHSHDHEHEHGPGCGHHHDVVYDKVVKASQKVASVLLRNAKTIELTFDQRQEVPHDVTANDGSRIVCHLHDTVEVGDKLVSNTNEWAIVAASEEELFEIHRGQDKFEEFLHVAGLAFWPVQLTAQGAQVVASHECMHMLEHFGLKFTSMTAAMKEISVPELKQLDCCDHDHGHSHSHDHGHKHGPDCGHDH
jgi:urease accessory protein